MHALRSFLRAPSWRLWLAEAAFRVLFSRVLPYLRRRVEDKLRRRSDGDGRSPQCKHKGSMATM